MDPQTFDVWYRFQFADQSIQPRIGKGQRVAAAEDHFVNRIVLAKIIDRIAPRLAGVVGFESGCRGGRIIELASETVTAMDAANAGRDHQNAAKIFLQQLGGDPRSGVADGVGNESCGRYCLFDHRQNLQQQRVARVAGADPAEELKRHKCREITLCGSDFRRLRWQPDPLPQLRGRADGSSHRLGPRHRRLG